MDFVPSLLRITMSVKEFSPLNDTHKEKLCFTQFSIRMAA